MRFICCPHTRPQAVRGRGKLLNSTELCDTLDICDMSFKCYLL